MTISDIRYTVLQVVNEVQRKLGLDPTPTLITNSLAIEFVDYINDVCDDLSDFGNWQEMMVSANVTAVSGQRDYSVTTSANIKNIGDIFFLPRTGPVSYVTPHDMRIMTRVSSTGAPSQYTIFGTDQNGNPMLRVRPTPGAAQNGQLFSLLYYIRCPRYTTSDAALVIPFPGNLVVEGVYARQILGESGGAPTDQYTLAQQEYLTAKKEALNRFNGDSGFDIKFTPGRR